MQLAKALVLAAIWASISGCGYAAQLDQSDIPETGPIELPYGGASLEDIPDENILGQTFTAGMTGRLTRLDLAITGSPYVQETGGFTVAVEQTPGVALASQHIDLSAVPRSFDVQWSDIPEVVFGGAGIPVVANEAYRIVLTVDPGTEAGFTGWLFEVNDALLSYPAGHGFTINHYGEFPLGLDYGFRTYVTTSVPEPATWWMLFAGFGAVGATLRFCAGATNAANIRFRVSRSS